MKLDNKKKVVSLSIMLAMTLSNCATQIASNTPVNNISQINQSSKILNNSINSISGTTNFGIQNKPYHVKATANDIKTETTVSLIYPADYLDVSLRNITIGTGLTLTDGSFSVNLNGFIPITSQVYVLDATKRIGGASNYQMTLRTLVKWTGSSWQSITTPGIDINAVSTALSIISSLNSGVVSSDNTIGKIPLLSNNASIVDIKDNATKNVILTSSILGNIVNYVNNILADNQDPVGSIYLLNGVYKIKPYEVNGFKTNLSNSKVAMNSAGNSVVVWTSNGQDGSGNGVYAQRYDSTGAKQGSEFLVNTWTTNNQQNPSVAMDSAGDFVVAWQSYAQEGSGNNYGVYAQRYTSATTLTTQGSEFLVNTWTTSHQINPSVSMDSAGDFVVAWQSFNQDGSNFGVYAQRYTSATTLTTQGSEFLVNTYTTSNQSNPSVAMDSAGDFVVAWQSFNQDGSNFGVYAQRYTIAIDKTLTTQGSEFLVNTWTTNNQQNPSVAMDSKGDFVIAWQSNQEVLGGYGVYAQRYTIAIDKTLTTQGSEFHVNTYTTGAQINPSVAMDSAGDFVVAWQSYNQDGSGYGVYAQRYTIAIDKTLTTQGSEFLVNTYTTGAQINPSVAMDGAGDFVVSWVDNGYYNAGIFTKRYSSAGAQQGTGDNLVKHGDIGFVRKSNG